MHSLDAYRAREVKSLFLRKMSLFHDLNSLFLQVGKIGYSVPIISELRAISLPKIAEFRENSLCLTSAPMGQIEGFL
jgi:hypothetical protein